MSIGVVGGGSWGTALACLLATNHPSVSLAVRDPARAQAMERDRENERFLPGIRLPANVHITTDLAGVAGHSSCLILAVPAVGMEACAEQLAGVIQQSALVITTAKGFDPASGRLLSEVLGERLAEPPVVLSGPTIAYEVGLGLPAACVVASGSSDLARAAQKLFERSTLRAYTSTDVVGVELGGILKNIVAIAAGVCDGLEVGDNAKAAVVTRGLAEMVRFGAPRARDVLTFAGLSGVGDCMVTCMSARSRNRRLGEAMGRGATCQEALSALGGMVVEGIASVTTLVDKLALDMDRFPLFAAVYELVAQGASPRSQLAGLMARAQGEELTGIRYT